MHRFNVLNLIDMPSGGNIEMSHVLYSVPFGQMTDI